MPLSQHSPLATCLCHTRSRLFRRFASIVSSPYCCPVVMDCSQGFSVRPGDDRGPLSASITQSRYRFRLSSFIATDRRLNQIDPERVNRQVPPAGLLRCGIYLDGRRPAAIGSEAGSPAAAGFPCPSRRRGCWPCGRGGMPLRVLGCRAGHDALSLARGGAQTWRPAAANSWVHTRGDHVEAIACCWNTSWDLSR